MRRTVLIRTALLTACLVGHALPARADVSVLVGAMTAGRARPMAGVSWGRSSPMIGYELELARTGAATVTSSSVGSFNANLFVQTEDPILGMQLYMIGGFGLYGETYQSGHGSGAVLAKNIGGGAKIGISGPIKLRLDYRVYILGDTPDASRGTVVHQFPSRFSVGMSFAF